MKKICAIFIDGGYLRSFLGKNNDFVPAVEEAKSYGAVICLFTDKNTLSEELFNKADEFYPLGKGFLEDCKLDGN